MEANSEETPGNRQHSYARDSMQHEIQTIDNIVNIQTTDNIAKIQTT